MVFDLLAAGLAIAVLVLLGYGLVRYYFMEKKITAFTATGFILLGIGLIRIVESIPGLSAIQSISGLIEYAMFPLILTIFGLLLITLSEKLKETPIGELLEIFFPLVFGILLLGIIVQMQFPTITTLTELVKAIVYLVHVIAGVLLVIIALMEMVVRSKY